MQAQKTFGKRDLRNAVFSFQDTILRGKPVAAHSVRHESKPEPDKTGPHSKPSESGFEWEKEEERSN